MTLIIMLILAGISLSGLIGEKGIFQKTENASNIYNEKKAREVLETVLLTDGQFEKNINPEYNEEEFLNKLIKDEIPGSDVRGNVAIIGGEYAYDLDRSVPKIGTRGNNGYLGNPKDLIWPDINPTVTLAEDKKDATIKIEASEKKNGVNKIEIWLLGEKIKEYTYDPSKPEVTENYIATQNGKYTIKAYGELMDSKTVEVDGILASVKFDPNGDNTWKKSHSTKVTIQETADKVVNSKYYWSNSVTTPDDSKFPENQNFKSGDTITKNNETGTYYLWTRLQTQSGEILKWRSEGFNFDNEGPTIELGTGAQSQTSFTVTATSCDKHSGTVKFEFYVDDKLIETQTCEATTESITKSTSITEITMGRHDCKVIVYDKAGNINSKDISGRTQMYCWSYWNVNQTSYYSSKGTSNGTCSYSSNWGYIDKASSVSFNSNNGYYCIGKATRTYPDAFYSGYLGSTSGVTSSRTATYLSNRQCHLKIGTNCVAVYAYDVTKYTGTATYSYKCGTTKYGYVYANSPDEYPRDDRQGSYWYKYVAIK